MLETQDWWLDPGDAVEGQSRHIHLATCFPLDQTLRGVVPFDIHIQLHMNPGVLSQVDLQVFGDNLSVTQIAAVPNFTCPTAQCDLWYHLNYDTTKVPADGYLEFRFHAKVTGPDGKIGYTSSGWLAYIANGGGRPIQSYRVAPWIEARGWYTGVEYENARFTSPIPSGPLSGLWTFGVKLAAGSGGTPVNHILISLDPHFHNVPVDRGNVIFEQYGPYTGNITIDTRTLSNGVHRLFMRTDSTIATGTASGVLAMNFVVNNGTGATVIAAAAAVVQTSLPILPSLAVIALLALIMPKRSARRRSRSDAGRGSRQLVPANAVAASGVMTEIGGASMPAASRTVGAPMTTRTRWVSTVAVLIGLAMLSTLIRMALALSSNRRRPR